MHGEKINVYTVLVGNRKRFRGGSRRRLDDNIKIDLRET
jgi:hypothetical protein